MGYDPNDREGQANTHFIAPTPIPNPRPSGSYGDTHRTKPYNLGTGMGIYLRWPGWPSRLIDNWLD